MCIQRMPTTSWPISMSFFSFPNSPVKLCCDHPQRYTFSRTTLRRHSGCASKVRKVFLNGKLFLTLCILFRCYSCWPMELLIRYNTDCFAIANYSAGLFVVWGRIGFRSYEHTLFVGFTEGDCGACYYLVVLPK